jgi:hypothetical protein
MAAVSIMQTLFAAPPKLPGFVAALARYFSLAAVSIVQTLFAAPPKFPGFASMTSSVIASPLMLALETRAVDTCARGNESVMAETVLVVVGLMLALETRAVDTRACGDESVVAATVVETCACGNESVVAATVLVIVGLMLALETRALDTRACGEERGGGSCWWRRERWTVMLAMRASMTRAVDACAGDVVTFFGEAWAGCRSFILERPGRVADPLSWERPGQVADPLSHILTLV